MIDAISTYVNGAELDRVSILDMDAYEDSEINWRVRRGYGALMAAYGAPCPLALNTQVTLIDHSGPRVRIETSRGTLSAARVIVTVPTNLIADEAIRFHPPLPAKVDAARGLPLGLADKVTLALDQPEALAQRRQSARRHHAHRDGRLSSAPVRPGLHRRLFRRTLRARAGRRRRRRDCGAGDRRDRGAARLRLPPPAKAVGGIALGPRPLRARLLFARAARPCRRTRRARRTRSTAACSLPARPPRRIFSRPRTGQGIRESGRQGR